MKTLSLIVAAGCALSAAAGAHVERFWAPMNGPSEAPPNNSPGTGWVYVIVDLDLATMHVQATFTGLTGDTNAAHIHGLTANPFAGTAGVMSTTPSYPGFPNAVTSGEYDRVFDMTLATTYNPAFVTAQGGIANAMNAFLNGLRNGRAYFNIHTSTFGGGEIRGFLRPACDADFSGSSDPNDPQYGFPDGEADAADFFYYLDQFTTGNVAVADLTGSADPNDPFYGEPDGAIDAADFFYYLDLFVVGCP
jgi:hypothetical protein